MSILNILTQVAGTSVSLSFPSRSNLTYVAGISISSWYSQILQVPPSETSVG